MDIIHNFKVCNTCNINKSEKEFRNDRAKCKECVKFDYKCIHNKRKSYCIECKGTSICIHNKRKYYCCECNGSQICIHNKRKETCKDCNGTAICIHNNLKQNCKDCNGSAFCIHTKYKAYCKECNGSSYCIHDKQKSLCIICYPNTNRYCKECRIFQVSKRNEYLCMSCFYFKYPNHQKVKNYKVKENQIIDDLLYDFDDIDIIRDKSINGGNSRYRPDILIRLKNYNIIIEIDENQHKGTSYSCENERIMSLFEDLKNIPLIIIRFNPDSYKHNNKLFKSIFNKCGETGKIKIASKKLYNERLDKLKEVLKFQLNNYPIENLTEIKLFYSNQF